MSLTEFSIVDTTLREGEQCLRASFSTDQKLQIAELLAAFGVEYIEVTSPAVSPQSRSDCALLARRGLPVKLATHIRCHMEDAKLALEAGVQAIHIYMATSAQLRVHSHGKGIDGVIDRALEVLSFLRQQAPHIELRFSTEDAFRSNFDDVLRIYQNLEQAQVVDRFGIADTVGIATPNQVYELVRRLRRVARNDIEFHGHNDTGCAIANSYAALEGGATHIDVTVLGIGERNGIAPLEGFVARMYAGQQELMRQKYRLPLLQQISQLVAASIGMEIPLNHYITGPAAFAHKAGVHAKAMLQNPGSYEIIDPDDFGLRRTIAVAHRLTGWHAVMERAQQIAAPLDEAQARAVTQRIKERADQQLLTPDDVDALIREMAQVAALEH